MALMEYQNPPTGEWKHWVIVGGRGAGKTYAAMAWLHDLAKANPGKNALIIAPNFASIADSTRSIGSIETGPWLHPSRQIKWSNGFRAICKTSSGLPTRENIDSIRGLRFKAVIVDENPWTVPVYLQDLSLALEQGGRIASTITGPEDMSPLWRAIREIPGTVITKCRTRVAST